MGNWETKSVIESESTRKRKERRKRREQKQAKRGRKRLEKEAKKFGTSQATIKKIVKRITTAKKLKAEDTKLKRIRRLVKRRLLPWSAILREQRRQGYERRMEIHKEMRESGYDAEVKYIQQRSNVSYTKAQQIVSMYPMYENRILRWETTLLRASQKRQREPGIIEMIIGRIEKKYECSVYEAVAMYDEAY